MRDKNLIFKIITDDIKESIEVKEKILGNLLSEIAQAAELIIKCLKGGNKIILFGNGGSAADAQHIAGELVGRFKKDRDPLPAISLTTDTSILTCIGNDYGFEYIFSRQLQALVKKGDIVIAISTSGDSPNIIEGIKTAKKLKIKTIALTGETGGKVSNISDITIKIPSKITPRIQEAHITIAHILCNLVDKFL